MDCSSITPTSTGTATFRTRRPPAPLSDFQTHREAWISMAGPAWRKSVPGDPRLELFSASVVYQLPGESEKAFDPSMEPEHSAANRFGLGRVGNLYGEHRHPRAEWIRGESGCLYPGIC